MIARRMRQCRPTFTCEHKMLVSTCEYEFTRTSGESTLLVTEPPEMMHPMETMESCASPVRPGSLKTNFAGGYCRMCVRMGHAESYKLKTGATETRSMLAS